MEFTPYEQTIRSIVVQQLVEGCGWVELIRFPIEDPEESSPEDIQGGIDELSRLLYEGDKIHLSVQGNKICIRGIAEGGTFRVCASPCAVSGPMIVP